MVPYSQFVQRLLKALTGQPQEASSFLTERAIDLLVTNRHFELTLFSDWEVNPLLAKFETIEAKKTFKLINAPNAHGIEASYVDLKKHIPTVCGLLANGKELKFKMDLPNFVLLSLVSYVQLIERSGLRELSDDTFTFTFSTANGKFLDVCLLILRYGLNCIHRKHFHAKNGSQ